MIGGGDRDRCQYLTFTQGSETFGIGILSVREILEFEEVTPLPMAPPHIRGIINLRGAAIPIVDFGIRLGRAPTVASKRTAIIIIDGSGPGSAHGIGMFVDAVNAVIEIGAAEIQEAPEIGASAHGEIVQGVARIDGKFVLLLKVGDVLRRCDSLGDREDLVGTGGSATASGPRLPRSVPHADPRAPGSPLAADTAPS